MIKENHIKDIDGVIRANLIINHQPFSSKIILSYDKLYFL